MSKLDRCDCLCRVARRAGGRRHVALPSKDGAAPAKKPFFEYSAATGNIDPVGESPPVDARLLAHGEWVYRGLCIGCHGVKGDGNGGVWTLGEKYAKEHKLPRQPRDFTVRGVQGALHAERLAAHRHRFVQGDLARPGGRPGHAGVQIPARA